MGEAYKDLAEVRYQQEARAKTEFFEPMRAIEKDLKEINVRCASFDSLVRLVS